MAELTTILRQQSKLGPINVARAAMRDAAEALDAKDKRIAELEAALEPFANYATADGLPGGFLRVPDEHPVLFRGLGEECRTIATIGDFRRVKALLPSRIDKEEENGGA